jgi:hypothetical protein
VNADATLYAQWVVTPVVPPGATLAEKLAYIAGRADDGAVYDIEIAGDEYISPQTISTMGRNVTVIIHSASQADIKAIQLESTGSLFSVNSNITLKLNNIVLKGISSNTAALVTVGQGGNLVVDDGAVISLNTNISSQKGGGVYLNNGTMTMNGGEISNNTVTSQRAYGGGIYLENNSSVILTGGIISNNVVPSTYYYAYGGGIYIATGCTATMNGGVISNNKVSQGWGNYGGGVFVATGGTFIKRHAAGTTTSGVIYGATGDMANTSTNGATLYRDNGTLHKVDRTLGAYDEITSASDEGWE